MKIYLGADHAGFRLKEFAKKELEKQGNEIIDLGNLELDKQDDFTDYAYLVAKSVSNDKKAKGILFCGTAQGMCIAANKVKGIVAAPAWNLITAKHAKENDDANILCLPAGQVKRDLAKKMISVWLKSKFKSAQKYKRRLKKIKQIEKMEDKKL